MTTHMLKPKLQIEDRNKYLQTDNLPYLNYTTSMKWKFNSESQEHLLTKRANSDISFYKSMTSYLLQRRHKN